MEEDGNITFTYSYGTVSRWSPFPFLATAMGFSVGHGIIGRSDGLVYMWELSTGKKLQNLHHFKDAAVSSIVSDDSSHRAVAIASDGGQLLVYLPS
ncbi:hypothetical protein CQW23_25468 [Capsicum baccatum]|uniref:Uncharacterized protein n=1 Tax=Capsicum baccatum TaxID=33114 RepID=A0A2G2VL23_CAPBA|nr:hypothetical protein FXO37_18639 [Capsicum annuum]PHT33668.1 hypothetical protein CQW23_25468 [Capsicum baccatum]